MKSLLSSNTRISPPARAARFFFKVRFSFSLPPLFSSPESQINADPDRPDPDPKHWCQHKNNSRLCLDKNNTQAGIPEPLPELNSMSSLPNDRIGKIWGKPIGNFKLVVYRKQLREGKIIYKWTIQVNTFIYYSSMQVHFSGWEQTQARHAGYSGSYLALLCCVAAGGID